MTITETEFDPAKAEAFGGYLFSLLRGSLLSAMVDIGHRTGLFAATAEGWGTSDDIAVRAGLTERYVREWLGAMATGGIVDYREADESFRLPPEHAAVLTGPGSMAPLATMNTVLAKHVHQVVHAFQEGGGVPYAAYVPEFTDIMDGIGRGLLDSMLIDGYLPLAPGLQETLEAGANVADFACGTGHALVILARTFPRSTFTGYDLDEHAIARARAEATGAGLTNVTFEIADVARVEVPEPIDVAFVFDAVHDQVDPDAMLARIHDALVPGGRFFMREPRAADTLAGNLANPMSSVLYSVSTLHCLTVSLAHGGAGIGTAFGEQRARRMLADAGFADPEVHDAPGDPLDAVYVTRRLA